MSDSSSFPTQFLVYPSLLLILLFVFLDHHLDFSSSLFNSHLSSLLSPPSLPSSSNSTDTLPRSWLPPVQAEKIYFGGASVNSTAATRRQVVRRGSFERIRRGLARARSAIRNAARTRKYAPFGKYDFVPRGSVYRNPYAFHQSYKEMEKRFRIWVYKEGERPIFHMGPMSDIYSVEGQFMDELESGNSTFLAKNPKEATSFFLPVSVVNIIIYVYRPYTDYSRQRLQNIVKDYIDLVSNRYPYWNRSRGADHFMVSCHDWAPDVSAAHPKLYEHFTRVLCNANTSEGFTQSRDVSLPEIKVYYSELGPPKLGKPPEDRSILAFFAGGEHGYVRSQLFKHWRDTDSDIRVHEYLPKNVSYFELMGQSKYCLCPSGYEVASPRIVESFHAGCVPVIISDYYVLPFSEVLNWDLFSVHIPISKIQNIKKILQAIPMDEYLEKQKRVMQVQPHFLLHRPAKPYDLLHMVMHSIWLRRLNIRLPPS